MKTFNFEDYTISDINSILQAINQLFQVYSDPVAPYEGTFYTKLRLFDNDGKCPLCVVSNGCQPCPWVVIEGYSCAFHHISFGFPSECDCLIHIERLNRWKAKLEARKEELQQQ